MSWLFIADILISFIHTKHQTSPDFTLSKLVRKLNKMLTMVVCTSKLSHSEATDGEACKIQIEKKQFKNIHVSLATCGLIVKHETSGECLLNGLLHNPFMF